jgi:hypothetical protein
MQRRSAVLALCAALWPAIASAQFETFSRQTPDGTQVALDLGISLLDDQDDVRLLRVDLYSQIEAGAGAVYVVVPWSVIVPEDDDHDGAVGNIEIGGFYDFTRGNFGLTAVFGLILPTAAEDGPGFFANVGAMLPRYTDPITALPEALGFRFGASPRFDTRWVLLRGDLGIDVGFPVGSTAEAIDTQLYVRLNAGLGLRAGPMILTAEFVNTANISESGPEAAEDQFIHSAGVTLSYLSRWADAHLGMVFPLDEAASGKVMAVTMGLTLYPDSFF